MNFNYIISKKTPVVEFVSLQTAKDHLKVGYIYEDALISSYIKAAIADFEDYTGVFLEPRDITIQTDELLNSFSLQYLPQDTSVFTVTYKDQGGVTVDISADYAIIQDYGKAPELKFIRDGNLPDTNLEYNAVSVQYVSGFTLASLPENIKAGLLLKISELYEYRANGKEIYSTRAHALWRGYKIFAQ